MDVQGEENDWLLVLGAESKEAEGVRMVQNWDGVL